MSDCPLEYCSHCSRRKDCKRWQDNKVEYFISNLLAILALIGFIYAFIRAIGG